jgi:hypothetical protein
MSRLILGGSIACALLVGLASTRARAEDDKNKCTIAINDDSDVDKACKAGGIKRAKATMKAMQKASKEKGGVKHECNDCHKDESAGDWSATKDSEEKWKKMLEVLAKK